MDKVPDSYTRALDRHAAILILRSGFKACLSEHKLSFSSTFSSNICHCAKCSFAQSILRGSKLRSEEKDISYVALKQISTAPLLWINSFAISSLKTCCFVFFYVLAITLPLTIVDSLIERPERTIQPYLHNDVMEARGPQRTTITPIQANQYPNAIEEKDQLYTAATSMQKTEDSSRYTLITEDQIISAVATSPSPQSIVGQSDLTSSTALSRSAPPVVSEIAHTSVGVNKNFPGIQLLAGSTDNYSALATDPKGLPLTWQWLYSIDGGTEKLYQSGTGRILGISFNYPLSSIGHTFKWVIRVSNGNATASSYLIVGVSLPPPQDFQIHR